MPHENSMRAAFRMSKPLPSARAPAAWQNGAGWPTLHPLVSPIARMDREQDLVHDAERPESRVPIRGVEDAGRGVEPQPIRSVAECLRAALVGRPGEAVAFGRREKGLVVGGSRARARGARIEVLAVA